MVGLALGFFSNVLSCCFVRRDYTGLGELEQNERGGQPLLPMIMMTVEQDEFQKDLLQSLVPNRPQGVVNIYSEGPRKPRTLNSSLCDLA